MSDGAKLTPVPTAPSLDQGVSSRSSSVISAEHESHLARQIMHRYRAGPAAHSASGVNTFNRCIKRKTYGNQPLLNIVSRYHIRQQAPLSGGMSLPTTIAVNRPSPMNGLSREQASPTDSVRVQTKIAARANGMPSHATLGVQAFGSSETSAAVAQPKKISPRSNVGSIQKHISTHVHEPSKSNRKTPNAMSKLDSTSAHTIASQYGQDRNTLHAKTSNASRSVHPHHDARVGAMSSTHVVSGPITHAIARMPAHQASQATHVDTLPPGNAMPDASAAVAMPNKSTEVAVVQPSASTRVTKNDTMISRQVMRASANSNRPLFRSVTSIPSSAREQGSNTRGTTNNPAQDDTSARSINRKKVSSINYPSLQHVSTRRSARSDERINRSLTLASLAMVRQTNMPLRTATLARQEDVTTNSGSMMHAPGMPQLSDTSAMPQASTKLQAKAQGSTSMVTGNRSMPVVQAQSITSTGQDSRGATPMSEYSMPNASDYANPISAIELGRVAEKVYEMLEQRLTIERESLGL